MESTGHVVVLITASTEAEAQRIAHLSLQAHLAACVSILSKAGSVFWWQGKLESAEECLLVAKTKASRLAALVELVKKNHSYDVPEVIAMPVVGGNPDYLTWIDKEVRE